MCQHFPNHLVPSLLDSNRNQSLSALLLFCTYCEKSKTTSNTKFNTKWKQNTSAACALRCTYGRTNTQLILIKIYSGSTWIKAWYSSFSLCTHKSLSRGPAFVLRSGIELRVFFVTSSTIFVFCQSDHGLEPQNRERTLIRGNTRWKITSHCDCPAFLFCVVNYVRVATLLNYCYTSTSSSVR